MKMSADEDMPFQTRDDTTDPILDLTAEDYEHKLKNLLIENNPTDGDSDDLIASKTETFVTLFDMNFKARKAVKLHQILANISTNFNANLLNSDRRLTQLYGKSIRDLPFGQLFEIWKLFLPKLDDDHKFLAKLFTIFLQHIRCLDDCLPDHFSSQLDYLENETRKILIKYSGWFSEWFDDEDLVDQEFVDILLELYFSFGSLIILQMTYNQMKYNSILEEYIEQLRPNEWQDLSLVYDFTDDIDWKIMFENIDNLSPKRRQTLVKCLFQKFHFWKVIEMNSELNEEQRLIIKSSIDQLLSSLVTNFAVNHLNSLTVQQIISMVQHSPSHKNLSLLTDSLASHILDAEEEAFDVHKLLMEGTVWESIPFQIAFIGSFWKQISLKFANKKRKLDEEFGQIETILGSLATNHSFWYKYATHSPNSQKPNKLWSNISDISSQTQQLIESIDGKTTKRVRIPLKLMQLFIDSVPLEYLLPANQMRCLLSLSLLLFGIDFSDDNRIQLLDPIVNSILRIFDGVRSVWFFNFIDPSVYLINFLKVVRNYQNIDKLKILMTKFVENIFRNSKQIEDLKEKLDENESEIPFELLVMTETIILKNSLHVMNMLRAPKKLEQLKQFCGPLSHYLSNKLHNQIKSHLMSETNIESLNSILVIDSFSAVFEFQVSKTSEETISLKTKWKKLLAKLIDISKNQLVSKTTNESSVKFLVLLCGQRKKLANVLPFESLVTELWHLLCRVDKQFEVLHLEFTLKDFPIDDYLNNKQNYEDMNQKMGSVEELNRTHFLETLSDQSSFLNLIKPLIIALIECSTAQEFEIFLKLLTNQLETFDYSLTSYSLKIWVALLESQFHANDEKFKLFETLVNDLMTLCANQCRKCNRNPNITSAQFQTDIKVPVLVIMRSVLHITKNVITSPQVFLSYHACIDTRLDVYVNEPEVFGQLFEAIYLVLNEVLLQHKYIAISSMAAFNLIVKNLILSLMTVAEEHKFVGYSPTVRHQLEICSKNSDRLLTLMSSFGADYSSFAPHLIAAYVMQTKSVSVHTIVKKNIISGINRLLKILTASDEIEMMYSRMDESSRNIFKMIYDNYDKYYKFKGQV